MGGGPADMLKNSMNPQAYIRNVLGPTMGMKKGGRSKHATDGKVPDYDTGSRTGAGAVTKTPSKPTPPMPQRRPPEPDYDTGSRTGADAMTEDRKSGGRTKRKAGGNVNYGPAENVGGKPGVSTKEQIAIEKYGQNLSKPTRGKGKNYADGGMAPYGSTAPVAAMGPDPKSIVQKNAMNFGAGAPGSPYKKGGMAKHEDVAEDKALIKRMVKAEARTAKFGGGGLSAPKKGGKGKTNINIVINPGSKPDDQMGGMPPMPPGLPPRPAGGIPVPMGMPPAGGAAPMPMPMPMPSAPAPTGMPAMGRKAGGKVYRTYKDMDAGAGSGLGRLEKTEIQKRKA
jgi:hypothetical protein